MKTFISRHFLVPTLLLGASLTGCIDLGNPNYPSSGSSSYGGYNNGGYGSGYDDDDYRQRERERNRHEAHENRREQERLEDERERLARERERLERERNQNTYRPPPQTERCPSGFSPSENKCSKEERKHGCRDMRLPGGLGCVSR